MEPFTPLQREFWDNLAAASQFVRLFDHLPDVYCYVKNTHSQFIAVNRAIAVLHGLRDETPMIGKSDLDFHPRRFAEQYIAEDQRVMAGGKPVPNQVWLVTDYRGELRWYLSTKAPLFGRDGQVIGLAGVMRSFENSDSFQQAYGGFKEVLAHVIRAYREPLRVEELAKLVHLSLSQFERRFKAVFQMTPQQYIVRVRLNAAAHTLCQTDRPVGEIALDCGFYDQSHLTRNFRRVYGEPPLTYRRRYRRQSAPRYS